MHLTAHWQGSCYFTAHHFLAQPHEQQSLNHL